MLGLREFRDALNEDRRLLPLLVMVGCSMFGAGLLVPVLSLYAVSFGVSATMIGMLVTMFGIGRIVANFPSGWLSQRLGRRPLLAAGPIIIAVGAVGAAITTDFMWLLVWRFLQGIGSGMYQTVSLAALADISSSRSRGRLVSIYHAAIQIGASIGPLIGGTVAAAFGLAAPFWVLLVISIVTSVIAITTFKDVEVRTPRATSGALGSRRGFLSPSFAAISLVSCIVFFTRTACMFQLLPLIGVETFGLGIAAIGVAMTVIAFAMLIVLPITGICIDRFGARITVIGSLAGIVVGLALVIGGAHPAYYWISMAIYGLAGGVNSAAMGAFTIETLPRHKYGEGMGLQRTFSDLGYLLGPVFAGAVADFNGLGNAGAIVANLALLTGAMIVFIFATVSHKPREN